MLMKLFCKKIAAASIGTALEFYDFALFGLLAPLISKEFFPNEDPVAAIISSYFIFAGGFLMRPLGGIIFGYIGDTLGRRTAMYASILTMMIPTCIIGFIPSYDNIGILSSILLALCRLVQGLCVGGEFCNAAIFIIEFSQNNRKYFSGSLVTASSVIGMLIASCMATFCTLDVSADWAWRIPFIFSVPFGVLGFYLRKYTHETYDFKNVLKQGKKEANDFSSLIRDNLLALFITFGIGSFVGIIYYINFVFLAHYYCLFSLLGDSKILFTITIGLLFYMLCLPLAGFLADKVGPQKVMLSSLIIIVCSSFPAFFLIQTGELALIIMSQIILSSLAGFFVGPANGLTASLFSVEERCRGVSLSFNLGISLFGGVTPVFLTAMIQNTNQLMLPVFWIMMGAAIALFSVMASIKLKLAGDFCLMPILSKSNSECSTLS